MAVREWVRFDVGLLDDERFEALPAELRGAWATAYLVIAREGDSVKSFARLEYLLGRSGIANSEAAVAALRKAGWLVRHSLGGYTLRAYEAKQPKYRGPSDDPVVKAERNARRPRTRAERAARGASVERGGASGATQDRTGQNTPKPPSGATDGVAPRGGSTTSLKDELKKHGYDPESAPGKTPVDTTS